MSDKTFHVGVTNVEDLTPDQCLDLKRLPYKLIINHFTPLKDFSYDFGCSCDLIDLFKNLKLNLF